MSLPIPRFHEDARAGQLYLERAADVAKEARLYAEAHRIRPAREDKVRIAAFGIDVQVAFCTPGASLFVPGAVEDTQRALRWLYANLGRITELVFSLDTHRAFQIFHPSWWQDAGGQPPPPLTAITADDIRAGPLAAHAPPGGEPRLLRAARGAAASTCSPSGRTTRCSAA